MKKILLVMAIFPLFGLSCSSRQLSSSSFNSDLVVAKQRCQEAADKWDEKNWKEHKLVLIRSHLNPGLNACFVEYSFSTPDESGMTIVDIFDGDKELLNGYMTNPSVKSGNYFHLFEKGKEIDIENGNLYGEYYKRANSLFEAQ